jgi:hypothetical protein
VTDDVRSISELHKRWAALENEHHELAGKIKDTQPGGADLPQLREKQAKLLLEINAVVAEIRKAPAHSVEDYLALLDVALEHEIDLAADMAFYGPEDYPMIARLLRAIAKRVPGFEFNSLRRWLSAPGQFEQLIGGHRAGDDGESSGCGQLAADQSAAARGHRHPRDR